MDGGLETKKNWISEENVINSYACQIRNDDDEYYTAQKKRFVFLSFGVKRPNSFSRWGGIEKEDSVEEKRCFRSVRVAATRSKPFLLNIHLAFSFFFRDLLRLFSALH